MFGGKDGRATVLQSRRNASRHAEAMGSHYPEKSEDIVRESLPFAMITELRSTSDKQSRLIEEMEPPLAEVADIRRRLGFYHKLKITDVETLVAKLDRVIESGIVKHADFYARLVGDLNLYSCKPMQEALVGCASLVDRDEIVCELYKFLKRDHTILMAKVLEELVLEHHRDLLSPTIVSYIVRLHAKPLLSVLFYESDDNEWMGELLRGGADPNYLFTPKLWSVVRSDAYFQVQNVKEGDVTEYGAVELSRYVLSISAYERDATCFDNGKSSFTVLHSAVSENLVLLVKELLNGWCDPWSAGRRYDSGAIVTPVELITEKSHGILNIFLDEITNPHPVGAFARLLSVLASWTTVPVDSIHKVWSKSYPEERREFAKAAFERADVGMWALVLELIDGPIDVWFGEEVPLLYYVLVPGEETDHRVIAVRDTLLARGASLDKPVRGVNLQEMNLSFESCLHGKENSDPLEIKRDPWSAHRNYHSGAILTPVELITENGDGILNIYLDEVTDQHPSGVFARLLLVLASWTEVPEEKIRKVWSKAYPEERREFTKAAFERENVRTWGLILELIGAELDGSIDDWFGEDVPLLYYALAPSVAHKVTFVKPIIHESAMKDADRMRRKKTARDTLLLDGASLDKPVKGIDLRSMDDAFHRLWEVLTRKRVENKVGDVDEELDEGENNKFVLL